MNEYEFYSDCNQKVDERKAAATFAQKKHTPLVLLRILIPMFLAVCLIGVLERVGFINNIFCLILTAITMCYGSFKVGRIWYKIKF